MGLFAFCIDHARSVNQCVKYVSLANSGNVFNHHFRSTTLIYILAKDRKQQTKQIYDFLLSGIW